ncbi:MAG: hypothetical protein JWO86_3865 [Myxococcaceae bacterium]|nr:hypothetical protein [Myxococcaceae bacterium]
MRSIACGSLPSGVEHALAMDQIPPRVRLDDEVLELVGDLRRTSSGFVGLVSGRPRTRLRRAEMALLSIPSEPVVADLLANSRAHGTAPRNSGSSLLHPSASPTRTELNPFLHDAGLLPPPDAQPTGANDVQGTSATVREVLGRYDRDRLGAPGSQLSWP